MLPLSPPQFLSQHSSPHAIVNSMFYDLRENMPLDGILVGFLDISTFTTYWIHHCGLSDGSSVPYAFVHTGPELRDLMENSTWDQEGNWIRMVNEPESIFVGKFFVRHMNSNDFSFLQVRSVYDATRRGYFILYACGKGRYTQRHADYVAGFEQMFILLTANTIKDFLLQQLQTAYAPAPVPKPRMGMEAYDIVAASPVMLEMLNKLQLVSQLPTPVLLTGETGVGKEMFADFIHFHSPRRDMPFIRVNCGAIPPTLLDSELFGHEKGAFTGAVSQKAGCFELAHKGTLLLDEIGEMPLDVQVRLLRVLQSGTLMRIGGNKILHTDTRIIAATNRDLGAMLRRREFREDLFYRLNVYHLHIPPLRERLEDIPLLVRLLLRNILKKLRINLPITVQPANIKELADHPWRGNVRELQNAIEASLINHLVSPLPRGFWITPIGELLEPRRVPDLGTRRAAGEDATENGMLTFDAHVRTVLTTALHHCAGKVHGRGGAAALLGLKESTLWGKLNKYGIRPQSFKH